MLPRICGITTKLLYYIRSKRKMQLFAFNYGLKLCRKNGIMGVMKISEAVALRIRELLKGKNMTLYKLEKESGVLHGTMSNIMYGRNKSLNLATIIQISKGFGISYHEFLNSPLLAEQNLDIE